jgi:hypothetical protein
MCGKCVPDATKNGPKPCDGNLLKTARDLNTKLSKAQTAGSLSIRKAGEDALLRQLGGQGLSEITHVGLYPDHEPVGSSLARSRDPAHISATLKKKIRS